MNRASDALTDVLPIVKNDKRTINGWALFDWANSAYALVITVAIFPAYFLATTDDVVKLWGYEMYDSTLYSWSISLAYLLIALVSPMLSGIADYGNSKKHFLKVFTTMGALSCMALALYTDMSRLWLAVVAFMLATIGFAGSLVFYNAFLPIIATEDQYDRVSAKGFSYGYIGSVILLVINLAMVQKPEWFGIPDSTMAVRLAFVMVGVWWLVFAQISFRRLPPDGNVVSQRGYLERGYKELRSVWKVLRSDRNTVLFLATFFCYNAGVQTLLFLASIFAEGEMGFKTSELIGLILLLQVVAILGSLVFSRISEWKGNKLAIVLMLLIWIGICGVGYVVQDAMQFYMMGGAVGFVMGGIQSLSRSTYAKFLPENTLKTTSFYSFYDVMDKISTVAGTFIFGYVQQLTGNMRASVLTLGVFFVVSLMMLFFVKIRRMQVK